VASSRGNNYLLVLYDCDTNFIFAAPFKNRTAKCILAAYQTVHQRLCDAERTPKLQRLDNECSTILKHFWRTTTSIVSSCPPAFIAAMPPNVPFKHFKITLLRDSVAWIKISHCISGTTYFPKLSSH
jgi:hypothetical protein